MWERVELMGAEVETPVHPRTLAPAVAAGVIAPTDEHHTHSSSALEDGDAVHVTVGLADVTLSFSHFPPPSFLIFQIL